MILKATKSIIQEFKDFAVKGNAIDMAVGIIIGAAFGKIVNSLVNDIIMPPIGFLIGGVDFSSLTFILKKATETTKAVSINYGSFFNTIINFTIISSSIFFTVKVINALKTEQPKKPLRVKKCPECQMDIPLSAKRCGHCAVPIRKC